MKIVFFGSSRYVFPIIEMLKTHFDLCLVVTTEEEGKNSVFSFCNTNNINIIRIASKDALNKLTQIYDLKPEIGIVADFGIIIPKEFLEQFPLGIINIHPSLLPKHRGPTPVQTALLNDDKITGVSIIRLDEFLDHGKILSQEQEIIGPEDTAMSLLEILFRKSAEMLNNILIPYQKGEITLSEQDHSKATFTKMLTKEDGFIHLVSFPKANELDIMTRAFYPWPGVWTKANVNEKGTEKIIKFLPFKKIQVEGKKEMSYKDFLNGYPAANSTLRVFLEKNV